MRPPAVRAKNSAGPNSIETSASAGANSMTPSVATVPPTKEASATIVSAAPARPFWVIL